MNQHFKRILLILIVTGMYTGTYASDVLPEHTRCYELLHQRDYDQAYQLAYSTLDADLSDADLSESLYIMAYSLRKKNMFSESIRLFERAIKAAPTDDKKAKLMTNLGAVFHYINEFESAVEIYRAAAKLSDLWAPTNYYNIAFSEIARRDYVAAADALDEGIRLCSRQQNEYYKAKLWNQYGIIERDMYEISGDPQHARLARQYFGYAREIRANKVEQGRALHYLATLDLLQQDTAHALTRMRQAVAAQPDDQYRFHTLVSLARITQHSDPPTAIQAVDSALALYPYITRSREEIRMFFLAQELGIAVPHFESEFLAYTEELEKAQMQHRAYIGRQVMEEMHLRHQRIYFWVGIALAGIAVCFLLYRMFSTRIKLYRIIQTD